MEEISRNIIRSRNRQNVLKSPPITSSYSELNNNTAEESQADGIQTPPVSLDILKDRKMATVKKNNHIKNDMSQQSDINRSSSPMSTHSTTQIKARKRSVSTSSSIGSPARQSISEAYEVERSITPMRNLTTPKMKDRERSVSVSSSIGRPPKCPKTTLEKITSPKSHPEISSNNIPKLQELCPKNLKVYNSFISIEFVAYIVYQN